MIFDQIKDYRLNNQFLNGQKQTSTIEVVNWLGAVQAQDYQGAKWAIAQRTCGLTSQDLDEAFNKGQIVRTHVLRPTWHFVAPQDIRWMLKLTAPRIKKIIKYYDVRQGVDSNILPSCLRILSEILEDSNFLTRKELTDVFAKKGIRLNSVHLAHILMHAELDGLIISGPLKGKQFSYALLDERAPNSKNLSPEESLAELTKRYFESHGPATVYDFAWWSGLAVIQAREGVLLSASSLLHQKINDIDYWFSSNFNGVVKSAKSIHLLPNYDEYVISFKDYSPILSKEANFVKKFGNAGVANLVIKNGQLVGEWKRSTKKMLWS